MKKNKKGFTLIELVIVIAVIAILAAVLIPTFGNIITKSKESAAMQTASTAKLTYDASFLVEGNTAVPTYYVAVYNDATTATAGTEAAYYFKVTNGAMSQKAEATKPTIGTDAGKITVVVFASTDMPATARIFTINA